MTIIFHEQVEDETSTTETTWQDKLTKVKDFVDDPDDYIVWYQAEIRGGVVDLGIAARATLDGSPIGLASLVIKDTNERLIFSGFFAIDDLSIGEHTFKIQFRGDSGQTTYCKRARVVVRKY